MRADDAARAYEREPTRKPKAVQKPAHLCDVDTCECRWTHSDSPGSGHGRCGFHYHLAQGHEQLAEWRKRDAEARKQEQRRLAGGPRYLKFGKDDA